MDQGTMVEEGDLMEEGLEAITITTTTITMAIVVTTTVVDPGDGTAMAIMEDLSFTGIAAKAS